MKINLTLPCDTGNRSVGSKTNRQAARAAWRKLNGPIPRGLWILHHCDNPICAEPTHLYAGTPKENTADMDRRNRRVKVPCPGEKNGRAKLTTNQVAEIREQAKTQSQRSLAREFKVSPATVCYIVNGERWK